MHQTGFQDVLAYAQIGGQLPQEIELIGVQPAVLDAYCGNLSPGVKTQLPIATALALAILGKWGAAGIRRTTS
jgi:hydrogenase maturation protease